MHPGCWGGWYLAIVQNCSTAMEVGSVLHVCHVWVEPVVPGYSEMHCPLCPMWPSWMALSQQVHCPQMALELRFSYVQPLPLVCHPQPALSWDWWVASSFYAGFCCTPPNPWGIPHRLVHWYRAAFPPPTPCFPISLVFYGSLWRQWHELGMCPQPPRLLPCYTCHNLDYGFVPLLLEMIQPSYGPIEHVLLVFAQMLKW